MSDISIGGLPTTSAPFRIGVVLSKTFGLLSQQFGKFLLLTFIPLIPLLLLLFPLLGRPSGAMTATYGVLAAVTGVLTFCLQIVAQATTLYGAFQLMRGQAFTVGQSLQVGLRRALMVIGVALLVGIAAGLASLLLIVPGVIVFCMYYVAVPVCVIEKLGVGASTSRSAALTKGYRWSIFGLVLLVGAISLVVSFLLTLLGGGIWGALLRFGWQLVATSYGAVLVAVVYHDLRVAKEGIDIESLANVFD
jgi:hypothetical protein